MQVDDYELLSMYVVRIYPMPMVYYLSWKKRKILAYYHYSRLIDEHYDELYHVVVAAVA